MSEANGPPIKATMIEQSLVDAFSRLCLSSPSLSWLD